MIDFHCHLDLYPEPEKVVRACEQHGIHVLSVTTTPSAWRGTSALAGGRIRTALGLHPQLAEQRKYELSLFDEILPETRYVGEVGLDGAPEFRSSWEEQSDVFAHILRSCKREGGKILSVHSRRASKPVLDCLDQHRDAGTFILHWFSGSFRDLDRAIEIGCWFSVGPAMLAGERGRTLAARMPKDRVLTETDGPFAQADGRPLVPWDVGRAVLELAEIWRLDAATVETSLDGNLRRLASSAASS